MQTAAPTPSIRSRIEALADYFTYPLRTGKVQNEAGSIVQTCISATAGDCELDL